MQVSYGPPGQRGVTTLMAVGADDISETPTDTTLRRGSWVAAAAWALGELAGNRTLANIALGGTLALFGVRLYTRCQTVAMAQPAPIPSVPAAAGW